MSTRESVGGSGMVLLMHGLVTYGPRDLDIASAMSTQGYDEVKWAEGQGMLAELVSSDLPQETTVTAAAQWYDEAVTAAKQALAAEPVLLAKLGLA